MPPTTSKPFANANSALVEKGDALAAVDAKNLQPLDLSYGAMKRPTDKQLVPVSNVVMSAIIGCELCERLAFYGLTGSLVLFLKRELNQSTAEAASNVNIFIGACYLCTLFGGFLADSWLGKYRCILYFVMIYQFGLTLISAASWSLKEDWLQQSIAEAIFWIGLYLVALGTGGIKPCVSTLGAEQFEIEDGSKSLIQAGDSLAKMSATSGGVKEEETEKLNVTLTIEEELDIHESGALKLRAVSEDGTGAMSESALAVALMPEDPIAAELRQKKESFFRWFYFSINMGSVVAFTAVAYLCQNVSFAVGYLVPTVMLLFAIVFYVSASEKYKKKPASGQFELWTCVGIMTEALLRLCKDRLCYGGKLRSQGEVNATLVSSHGFEKKKAGFQKLQDDERDDFDGDDANGDDDWHWILYATKAYGGSYTNAQVVKCSYLVNVLPFIWLFGIFWAVYAQMGSLYFAQGCQMDLRLVSGFSIPIACLNLFNGIPILLFVPLMDQYLMPFMRQRMGLRVTMLQRIGVGFLIAAMAMVCAAVVEYSRKSTQLIGAGNSDSESTCDDSLRVTEMSIFWQIPQFSLVGLSEVLASVTGLEFFFSQSPASMRTTLMALFLVTTAFGSLFVPILILVVNSDSSNKWITNDLDNGHLDYYFLLLAILTVAATALFAYQSTQYEYQYLDEESEETDGELMPAFSQKRRRPPSVGSELRVDDEAYHTPPATVQRDARRASSVVA